jgi:hypothetical protein
MKPSATKKVTRQANPPHAHGEVKGGISSISTIAWVPQQELDQQGWASAGRRLGAIGRGSQWWVGDWIRYGTARWGERYVEAARITNYDVHTLRNMAYVASRFKLSLRRDNLTWSHHALLAALTTDEQKRWLDRASKERLSVADLRMELRSMQRGAQESRSDDDNSAGGETSQETISCPKCGHEIDVAASEPSKGGRPPTAA